MEGWMDGFSQVMDFDGEPIKKIIINNMTNIVICFISISLTSS